MFHCLEITQVWVTTEKPCSKLDFPNKTGLSHFIWKVQRNHKTCFTVHSLCLLSPCRRAWRQRTDQGNARVRVPQGPLVWQRLHRAKGLGSQSHHRHSHLLLSTGAFPDGNPCHWFQGSQAPTGSQKARYFVSHRACAQHRSATRYQAGTDSEWEGLGCEAVFPGCCVA